VTEAICGIDLVEWQFRIAAGEPLPLHQKQVRLNGHAVEARLYAEDPENGFLPSTGRILALELPTADTVRVDTGVESGSEVSAFYDPLLAKFIAHAKTREGALDALAAALHRTLLVGPRTNAAFLQALLHAPQFRSGRFDTGLIDRNLSALGVGPQPLDAAAAALGVARLIERQQVRLRRKDLDEDMAASPWDAVDGFQLSGPRSVELPIIADGRVAVAKCTYSAGGTSVSVEGCGPATDARIVETQEAVYVLRDSRQTIVQMIDFEAVDVAHLGDSGAVTSPMHGKVLQLFVAKDETVRRGQRLAIVEAMKMEHAIVAPMDGVVVEIAVAVGDQIAERAIIMSIAPAGT
jgi:3-methylcrotonyl-CoA carboxylase alpha subunit